MTAQIIPFPAEQVLAQCPECEGLEFYITVGPAKTFEGVECCNCGWEGEIVPTDEETPNGS